MALSALGARLGTLTIPTSSGGYQALQAWAQSLGPIRTFGIEGTGSYGAGLSRFLCEKGHPVFEVNRPSRHLRHQKGKDDTLDAESAARSLLAGQATAMPKAGTSTVEMIRHLKVARDTASSRAAGVQRWVLVSAPGAASAPARQRSRVAILTPTSRETTSMAALSGDSSRATMRSLNACPYRATA